MSPISTKKNTAGSNKTQGSARASRCELKQRSKLNCAAIPTELIPHAQWVVWGWEIRKGKWNKPPYQLNSKLAKANDPTEGELSEAEDLLLRAPKRRQFNSPRKLDDRQVGRLAPFRDCLDQPR
jgi:hypothetical protein